MADICTGRIMANEAHLPPAARAFVPIRRLRPRRSRLGWLLFAALILLNEVRGLYVATHAWQALFG